jgi:diguanylate cyclase (GGDEF)-like protein
MTPTRGNPTVATRTHNVAGAPIRLFLQSIAQLAIAVIWLLTGVLPLALPATANAASATPAPPAVDVADTTDRVSLNGAFAMFRDYGQAIDFNQVRSSSDLPWQTLPAPTINFGQSTAAFWFHFALRGTDALHETTYLRLNYPHLDQVDFYILRDGALVQQIHTGDTTPFDTRPVRHRTFLIPITQEWGDHVEVYLRTQTGGPIEVPLDVITRSALDREDKALFTWYGAYFGVTLAMLLYNAFILLVVRDISYFYYILYVATTMALQFTLQGFSFEYLWPWSTSLNNTMVVLLTGLMPFSAVAFVGRFIGINTIGTQTERTVMRLLFGAFCIALVSVFIGSYHITLALENVLALIAMTLGLYLGVKYAAKGFKSARIFTAAWLIYLAFVGYYLADINGAMHTDVISRHSLEIGSLAELVLLSLAFADRISSEKELRLAAQKEALDAQFELNRDLDRLVAARTRQLEEANLKLREISITDSLTGLYNRRYFNEIFDREYRRAFREQRSLAVLMIDVDHFKVLNDTHGHQAGDACLAQVAEIIRTSVRRPPDLIARYGGEEFIALLPSTDLAGACCVAELVCFNIADSDIIHNEARMRVTVSIGVAAEIPTSAENSEKLLKLADERLYRAKEDGRNRVHTSLSEVADMVEITAANSSVVVDQDVGPGGAHDQDGNSYAVLL